MSWFKDVEENPTPAWKLLLALLTIVLLYGAIFYILISNGLIGG